MLKLEAEGRYRLESALTFGTVASLRPQGLQALSASAASTGLVFELAAVHQVDSAGLALLVDWLAAARLRGAPLRFAGLSPQLRALARLSDVEGLLVPAG
jgi:ABC-type transporter Mla MlaB component